RPERAPPRGARVGSRRPGDRGPEPAGDPGARGPRPDLALPAAGPAPSGGPAAPRGPQRPPRRLLGGPRPPRGRLLAGGGGAAGRAGRALPGRRAGDPAGGSFRGGAPLRVRDGARGPHRSPDRAVGLAAGRRPPGSGEARALAADLPRVGGAVPPAGAARGG